MAADLLEYVLMKEASRRYQINQVLARLVESGKIRAARIESGGGRCRCCCRYCPNTSRQW